METDIFISNYDRLITKARTKEKIIANKSQLDIETKPIYYDQVTLEMEIEYTGDEFGLEIESFGETSEYY